MKKKLLRVALFWIGFMIFSVLSILGVVQIIPDQYGTSYQRAIVRQYDYYRSLHENKIVFVGNSSMSFGLDLDLIEELTDRQCAILGNHAGFGLAYFMNMSKSNLKKGDIVVLEYFDNTMETVGTELLLTGIGKRFDMYRFFPLRHIDNIIMDYNKFVRKTLAYAQTGGFDATGSGYSIDLYDRRGNISEYRGDCLITSPYEEVAKTFGWNSFSDQYDLEFISYVNKYIKWCNRHGVSVYVERSLPVLDESLISTNDEIIESDRVLASLLDAPLISNTLDYIYPREYIWNATYHCNTAGAEKRTQQLYEDMKNAGVFLTKKASN